MGRERLDLIERSKNTRGSSVFRRALYVAVARHIPAAFCAAYPSDAITLLVLSHLVRTDLQQGSSNVFLTCEAFRLIGNPLYQVASVQIYHSVILRCRRLPTRCRRSNAFCFAWMGVPVFSNKVRIQNAFVE